VLISLTLDHNGHLREDPEIITRGFVYKRDADELIASLTEKIARAVERSTGDIHNHVVQTVRSHIFNETKSRPTVLVTLSWV